MVEVALGVALGLALALGGFLLITWVIMESVYLAWLWKNRRKRRYHG